MPLCGLLSLPGACLWVRRTEVRFGAVINLLGALKKSRQADADLADLLIGEIAAIQSSLLA